MQSPEQLPVNACLFLDVDGTLIDLAPTPDTVVVPPDLVRDLRRAEQACGGALALVSGRSIADLDRLFPPWTFNASGVHGAEFRLGHESWSAASPLPDDALRMLAALVDAHPGTLAENKAYSFAVHYRAVPESGPAILAGLERILAERPDLGLQILPGHSVYELKRPGVDKGAAIRTLMERAPFAGRVPVFVGDDVTDAPGFVAVSAIGGRAYSVGRPFPDVSGTFAGPHAVRRWLAEAGGAEGRPS